MQYIHWKRDHESVVSVKLHNKLNKTTFDVVATIHKLATYL